MYTFALTTCGLIFTFAVLAIILDNVLDHLVYEPINEDFNDEWWGIE